MSEAQAAARNVTDEGGLARSRLFTSLTGLAALAIILQGVWAGLFIHEGHDYRQGWVDVHARDGDIAIALAVAATVVAFVKLRSRTGLLVGSVAFTVLLALEAFLGGLVGDVPAVTIIHFPLALALMALAIWLPLRSRRS
ncbi:MAG: hypothetical protein J2P23_04535 [Microlunatus sp.]|nr:hypothetical protein [Microlunatus sp.]